ncbi:MAG: GTPase Era [Lachnospiraceae bacterium]|nr:GTPase Era [Lachnospiraceae bacterium]
MKEGYRSGFVTIIGRPNVGKSTLMNHLIGQKIAITSNKAQTTRNRIQTVYTCEEGQIIFLDTPGVNRAKNKLGEYMMSTVDTALSEMDVVLWLVEPTTYIGKGERAILERLKKVHTPILLIINKIDTVPKEEVVKAIEAYSAEYEFQAVIPVSALRDRNTKEVVKTILKYLPEGPQYYDEDTITDQPERQIVAEIIREKALRLLEHEVPHGIAVVIDRMKDRPRSSGRENDGEYAGIVDIDATIICERDSHKGIIIGKQGAMLKKIGTQARMDIEKLLDTKVNLKLWVKIKKDWRDSEYLLKNFGYEQHE